MSDLEQMLDSLARINTNKDYNLMDRRLADIDANKVIIYAPRDDQERLRKYYKERKASYEKDTR